MKLSKQAFRNINVATIVAVYFLILVGGIVRVTGSGMGCPDWPKCFAGYFPPNNVSELPDGYQEVFLQKRVMKNQRLSTVLASVGMSQLASRVSNDPLIHQEESFNPTKAWIEYVNRLIGVAIGLLIVVTALFSFSYWSENRLIPILALSTLVLVIFQGWVGSLVVSTNLLPGFVSFHMALALLLVALLIYTWHLSLGSSKSIGATTRNFKWMSVIMMVLFLPQVMMGTQVREDIDGLVSAGVLRSNWISNLTEVFYIHRTFSLLLAALCGWMVYLLSRLKVLMTSQLGKVMLLISAITIAEIAGGAGMAYFEVPAFLQPLHLLGGSILFGAIFYLILISIENERRISV
ncbi:MAG: COX15/CtaA family protein [Cyclobacteriaceae bacterium]|nr:COX15/CtaA family protein [Cyclobacteriaceae bacterium HetDA_MAG_MS6]